MQPILKINASVASTHLIPECIANDIEAKQKYFHATFGSLPISVYRNAINRKYYELPGVTVASIDKYLKPHPATDMGHMKRKRQNPTKSNNIEYDFEDSLNNNIDIAGIKHKILKFSLLGKPTDYSTLNFIEKYR